MDEDDPIEELAKRLGVEIERRDVGRIEQIIASGLGSLGGQALGRMAGLGWIGVGIASMGGAIAGHVAASYQLKQTDAQPAPEPR